MTALTAMTQYSRNSDVLLSVQHFAIVIVAQISRLEHSVQLGTGQNTNPKTLNE